MSVSVCKRHFWWRQIWRHLHVTMLKFWAKFSNVLIHWSIRMILAKNYETVFKFVKVMPRKLVASFFLDTVYIKTSFRFFRIVAEWCRDFCALYTIMAAYVLSLIGAGRWWGRRKELAWYHHLYSCHFHHLWSRCCRHHHRLSKFVTVLSVFPSSS